MKFESKDEVDKYMEELFEYFNRGLRVGLIIGAVLGFIGGIIVEMAL